MWNTAGVSGPLEVVLAMAGRIYPSRIYGKHPATAG
jgi:hypothetical protein